MSSEDVMAGDAEAAGAVAGMVEAFGAPAASGDRRYECWVANDWRAHEKRGGFRYYEFAFDVVSKIDGHVVLRSPNGGSISVRKDSDPLHSSRAAAIVDAINTLVGRRELLTEQIDALRQVLQDETAAVVEEGHA